MIASSSRHRPLLDFMVVGAQKGGTVALHRFLSRHPEIGMSSTKEVHLFDAPEYSPEWSLAQIDERYRPFFRHAGGARIRGESTPIYLFFPEIARELRRYNPELRLIVLLRDPVERAISHYYMERNREWERLPLWQALLLEPLRLRRCRDPRAHRSAMRVGSYRARGLYSRQLRNLYREFDRDRVLILRSRDLRERHDETLRRVFAFLGVSKEVRIPRGVHNAGRRGGRRHRLVSWLLRFSYLRERARMRALALPEAARPGMRRSGGRPPAGALLVFALLFAFAWSEPVRAQCREPAEALQAALAARDLEEAARRHEAMVEDPGCGDALIRRGGRALSYLHAWTVQERMDAGEELESQVAVLERGLDYARTWPLLALLGDAAHDDADYGRASALYREALLAIDDAAMTPSLPPESDIERVYRLAVQSSMLAEDRVAHPPLPGSSVPGVIAGLILDGLLEGRAPVPVTFHFGSAEFTPQGLWAAIDMAACLRVLAPERITLVGHADPVGFESGNLALSRERAGAVAAFLRERGFEGRIEVLARGESEPFAAFEPDRYGFLERWRMDRRVELVPWAAAFPRVPG